MDAPTPRPWSYDERNGFIWAFGEPLAQTWNKQEDEFPNAKANGRHVVMAVNAHDKAVELARAVFESKRMVPLKAWKLAQEFLRLAGER